MSTSGRAARRPCRSPHTSFVARAIGALLVRSGSRIPAMVFGGHQESGIRPGTEVTPLAAGMAKSLELWRNEREELTRRITSLRDRFEAGVLAAVRDRSFMRPTFRDCRTPRTSRFQVATATRCSSRSTSRASVHLWECPRKRVVRASSGSAGDGVFTGGCQVVATVQRGLDEHRGRG